MILVVFVVVLACAVYATLLARYLAERSQAAAARPKNAGPPVPPCCAGNDLADPRASAWTALDDHQLTRLLKESSS